MRLLRRLTRAFPLLLAPGLLLAGSSAIPAQPEPVSAELARTMAEARAAEAEVQKLERAAREATGQAEKLRARQAAAAEAIAAAEARISAADARLRMIAAEAAIRAQRLEQQQAPAGALLAGLAMMASRPPMVAILDEGSTDEFVRVRLLLDSTLPAIRNRTAKLSAEIEQGRRLQETAQSARLALQRERETLAERRAAFAALEDQALRLAEERGAEALGAGDVALARREQASGLAREERKAQTAEAFAAELAQAPGAPARPLPADGNPLQPPIAYVLPAAAKVAEGFEAVSTAGIKSRGLTLATVRGTPVRVPATGIVRFAGPFRSYDGIVIIDHGSGWMSLIVNISSPLKAGTRVDIGQPMGRALGRLGVELSKDGRRVSPALIAGSSRILSNGTKYG